MLKEYKLHNTDGKTFFDFRSDPKSRCEGFTLTFCDDGTVVMSGDYGCLCWKRNYHREGEKDFCRDYGFPNHDTGIEYFNEKVCQHGVEQQIEEWNTEESIKMFKERYEENKGEERYKDILEQLERLEEYDEIKFYDIVGELDYDLHSYNWKRYTDHFKFIFEILKSVSKQIINAVQEKKDD